MKLKKLEVSSFGGINPQSPVVIDFSESNFVRVSGENGANKSSLLNALLVSLGHLSKDNKDFINKNSGKIDIDFEFVGNDRKTYRVHVTKSQFILEYEGESLPEPMTKLKELCGIPGVNPIEIKSRPLKDIVKWLSEYTNRGAEEYDKEYNRLKMGIKTHRAARATANKEYKALAQVLGNNPMYVKWEESEAKYGKKQDIKALSAKLDEAGKNSDNFIAAETKLKQLKQRQADLLAELAEVEANIKKGERFVENNKDAKKTYDQVRAEYDNAAAQAVNYERWQTVKRQKIQMDGYETAAQEADFAEKELLEEVKQLQAEIIPDVKGVSLVLDDEYEDGKLIRSEGFYIGDVNAAQASTGVWIKTIIEVLKKNKTKILVLDNCEALGGDGIKLLENLAKNGCYILAAEVKRGSKKLEIEYL